MKIGDTASSTKIIRREDVINFSALTLDSNPIHYDEDYASTTRFTKCIAQGPMISSLIGGVLGSKLPGNGTIYLSQNLKFLKPVFIDDEVTASVEIIDKKADKPIYTLKTSVKNQHDELVIDGEAVVLFINED